ncbi:MAG: CobW family GTP-binding protein [Bacillaceae bacterium]
MTKLPVTILTGFLGSGKTTLLNRILTTNHGLKLAVIVNEIGAIGIDHQLVVQTDEDVIEMTNGCVCCTFREDLIITLQKLNTLRKEGKQQFDGVILETTGMANPGPIISSFFLDEAVNKAYAINGVVTVVDGFHIKKHLEKGMEAEEQLAFADIIIVNKEELLTPNQKKVLLAHLREYNVSARIEFATYCDVDISALLHIQTFKMEEKLAIYQQQQPDSRHREGVISFALTESKPLDMMKLNEWMTAVVNELGENLYRYKGIISLKDCDKRLVFQGVHALFAASFDRPWMENEERTSQMVFIGRNLNKQWFEDCFRQLVMED